MTIEIKGTKPGRDAPEGAERYVSRSADRRSGVPYFAAVAVASVAAYLKSLLLPRATLAEEVDPEIAAARADALRLVHSEELAAPTPAKAAEAPKPLAEPPSPVLQSGMSLFDDGHELLARGLRFARPDAHPDLGDFKASPVIPQPINDNGGSLAAGPRLKSRLEHKLRPRLELRPKLKPKLKLEIARGTRNELGLGPGPAAGPKPKPEP